MKPSLRSNDHSTGLDPARFDLAIEGGTVVTPASQRMTNVYVRNGRVALLSEDRLPARERVDAGGMLVMSGMVDAHVHFMDPGALEREDFPHGSAAALRSGVTTVVEHSHPAPVRTAAELRKKAEYLGSRSRCDFALAAHAWPGMPEQVGTLAAVGAAYIKVFTCSTHGIPAHDRSALEAVFRQAASAGVMCLVHCEDDELTAQAESRLRGKGRGDGGIVPEWRSREAELKAVEMVAEVAAATGAQAVIAHASSGAVVDLIKRWRARGAHLNVESCPQYLCLLEREVLTEGAFRKFTPPARARDESELRTMWSAVASGGVDYISSDHAPSTRAQKQAASIWDAHFGLPGIDTTFSVLLDAAARGVLTYSRVVELYSFMPASLYGLHSKGRLQRGADADIVVVDPAQRWTVADTDVLSLAAWSPFSGRTFTGRTVATYLRGRKAMVEGEVLAQPGWGQMQQARPRSTGWLL